MPWFYSEKKKISFLLETTTMGRQSTINDLLIRFLQLLNTICPPTLFQTELSFRSYPVLQPFSWNGISTTTHYISKNGPHWDLVAGQPTTWVGKAHSWAYGGPPILGPRHHTSKDNPECVITKPLILNHFVLLCLGGSVPVQVQGNQENLGLSPVSIHWKQTPEPVLRLKFRFVSTYRLCLVSSFNQAVFTLHQAALLRTPTPTSWLPGS